MFDPLSGYRRPLHRPIRPTAPNLTLTMPFEIGWPSLRSYIENVNDDRVRRAQISRENLILGYKYVSDLTTLQEEKNAIKERERRGEESHLVERKWKDYLSRSLNVKAAWNEYDRNLEHYAREFTKIFSDLKHKPTNELHYILEVRVRELRGITPPQELRNRQSRQRERFDEMVAAEVNRLELADVADSDAQLAQRYADAYQDLDAADAARDQRLGERTRPPPEPSEPPASVHRNAYISTYPYDLSSPWSSWRGF